MVKAKANPKIVKRKPNRTKTLLRQVEKKKRTIQNIRRRKKENAHYDRLARVNGRILGKLKEFAGI